MTRERALKVLEMFLDKQCSIERTLNHMDTTDVEIWDAVYTATKALSAEPLTDKEQRIFLSAMGREEKVCREVDAGHPSENYEDTLLSVCRSITRKVKGALWG